jgi:hypothetical protein
VACIQYVVALDLMETDIPLLTPLKTSKPSNSPSPKTYPAASTSSASRASRCTKRRALAERRFTCRVRRSRLLAVAVAVLARWSRSRGRTDPMTRDCCGRIILSGRATRPRGRMCGRAESARRYGSQVCVESLTGCEMTSWLQVQVVPVGCYKSRPNRKTQSPEEYSPLKLDESLSQRTTPLPS